MNKRKGCLWLLVLAIAITAISPLAYANDRKVVNTVSIQLKVTGGPDIHPTIEERIKESILKVASHLLVGQEVGVVQASEREIGQVVKTVFNTVLRGYKINEVQMVAGEKTVILFVLQPTSLLIESVELNLQLQNLNDTISQVIDSQLAGVRKQVEEMLIGLPIDALIWADDVIEPLLYRLVKTHAPGFEPKIDLTIDRQMKVNLSLKPVGQLVEEIQIDLRTNSLPQLLTRPLERMAEAEAAPFIGLPVEFLRKYEDRLSDAVEDALHQNKWGKHVYLSQKPVLTVGPATHLQLDAEWIDYQVDFVGELNLGKWAPKPGPALHLSLGKRFGRTTMVKLKDTMTLDHLLGTWSVVLAKEFPAGFTAEMEYRFRQADWKTSLDWRKDSYGITMTQQVPGEFKDFQVSLNYYPAANTQVSLNSGRNGLWISLQQVL